MAITVVETPISNSSAHDDLWHVVESTNSQQVDFKYVFDLYVDNVQLIRAKVYPNPSDSLGYFNVSNIISNEMKFDWFVPNGNFVMKELNDSGEIYLSYDYKIGEDVAGITTLNMESGTVVVANCTPNLFGRRLTGTSSFLNTNQNKYKTSREKTGKSNYGEDFYIGIDGHSTDTLEFRLKQYSSSNTLLSTTVITFPASTTSNFFQLNISPDAINQGVPASGNIFSASCSYYDLEVWNTTANPDLLKDTFRIYFDCNMKYEVINLHFLNNFGLFDTARFTCVSKLSMDVQRKTFEQPDYRFNAGVKFYDNIYPYDGTVNKQYYESKVNYGSQYQWSYKLTMDFPSDQDYEWLAELIMSPQVWAEFRTETAEKQYYPVSIKATNYEYSKHINNGLRAFEVEIDMNQKRNGFRR